MFLKINHVHFIGIGGSGMSGIAELLHNLGYRVSGSDIAKSENIQHLQKLGIAVTVGHHPKNIQSADVVVYSSAIQPDNRELCAARDLVIPVIPRAEMLAELMRMKYGIAIAEIAEQIGTGNNTAAELVAAATAIHLEVLANVWEQVPEQAKSAIAAAINASATGHAAAVAALGEMGVGPSDIPGMPDEVRQRLEDILGGTLPASGPPEGVPPDNGEGNEAGPPEDVPGPLP